MTDSEDENPLVLESFTTLNPKISYSRLDHFKNCIKKYVGVNKIKNFEEIKSEILKVYDKEKELKEMKMQFF